MKDGFFVGIESASAEGVASEVFYIECAPLTQYLKLVKFSLICLCLTVTVARPLRDFVSF